LNAPQSRARLNCKSKALDANPVMRGEQRCVEPHCAARYGLDEPLLVCSRCGGLLEIKTQPARDSSDLRALWQRRRASSQARDRSGVWRFRELLPFDEGVFAVTLFEGNTPLYEAPRSASYCGLDRLLLKHQGCNPTGSFKDTGMTVAVTQAVRLGAQTVVCASTGNTAASLAAYAARADLRCAILVPRGQISHAKLVQSLDYGATVLEIEGDFDRCMSLIRELSEEPSIYVVNSINPFRLEGQKTTAFELLEQLAWEVPDHVIVPGGNLGNVSALGKGFLEMLELGLIERLPRVSVAQAEGAAPLVRFLSASPQPSSLAPISHPATLATAIKIGAPVSWKKAARVVQRTGGRAVAVSELEIAEAKAVVGRDGIGCEPASAAAVAGIKKLVAQGLVSPDERVVAVLTGHVLKDADYAMRYHTGRLFEASSGRYRNAPQRVEARAETILTLLSNRNRSWT